MVYQPATQPKSLPTHELGFAPPPDAAHEVTQIAQKFLGSLEYACRSADAQAFTDLFLDEGFWRDIIAFTSDWRTIQAVNILQAADVRALRPGHVKYDSH